MTEQLEAWQIMLREFGSFGILAFGIIVFFWKVLPMAIDKITSSYEQQSRIFQTSLKEVQSAFQEEIAANRLACANEIAVSRQAYREELALYRDTTKANVEHITVAMKTANDTLISDLRAAKSTYELLQIELREIRALRESLKGNA